MCETSFVSLLHNRHESRVQDSEDDVCLVSDIADRRWGDVDNDKVLDVKSASSLGICLEHL